MTKFPTDSVSDSKHPQDKKISMEKYKSNKANNG